MRGAIHALVEILKRLPALRFGSRARQQLQLKLQRRQRRTQFMRGIGDKRALAGKCALEPVQERIECRHERCDLARHVVDPDLLQTACVALRDLGCQSMQRRQRAFHQPPDQQRHQRCKCQQRSQAAKRCCRRKVATQIERLRNLDDAVPGSKAVDAPRPVLCHDVAETQDDAVRQRVARMRQIKRGAAVGPDPHHHFHAIFAQVVAQSRMRNQTLVAQR